MKKLYSILLIAIILLSSCAKPPQQVFVTNEVTRQVTQKVTQIVTSEVTKIVRVEITKLVIVTATYSGPTNTPEPTKTPKPTPDITKTDKIDGSYMVGKDIAPGIWRSSGGDPTDECWITIKNFSGDLIDIAGDLPGGTIRVPDGQYIVYIGGGSGNLCIWTWLSP